MYCDIIMVQDKLEFDGGKLMQETFFVNQKQYTVIRLLGHGKGGYSYLVERNGCQYVLKQIHHEPCNYYSFGNKIEAC